MHAPHAPVARAWIALTEGSLPLAQMAATPTPATPGATPAATPGDFDALLTVQEHLEQVRSHQANERSVSQAASDLLAL